MDSHIDIASARAVLWKKRFNEITTQTVPKSGTGGDCVTAVAGATVAGVHGVGVLTSMGSMGCPTDSPCVELPPPVARR